MYAEEIYVNVTEGYRMGKSGIYETFTNNIDELFKRYQKEYGRYITKIYIDNKEGKPIAIGWVFEKRVKYIGTNEFYLQEVWVTLHKKKPETITNHYYKPIT